MVSYGILLCTKAGCQTVAPVLNHNAFFQSHKKKFNRTVNMLQILLENTCFQKQKIETTC